MCRFDFYVFLLLSSVLKYVTNYGEMLGPADFEFQYLEYCADAEQGQGIQFAITQRKLNRSVHVFNIELHSEYEISNSLNVECKGSLKKQGGYKQGSFLLDKPICDAFNLTLGNIFTDFLKAINLTDCPIPAGSYNVDGFFFDNTKFNVPQVYGEYKMEFFVRKDDELLRCFNGYYEFRPKSYDS